MDLAKVSLTNRRISVSHFESPNPSLSMKLLRVMPNSFTNALSGGLKWYTITSAMRVAIHVAVPDGRRRKYHSPHPSAALQISPLGPFARRDHRGVSGFSFLLLTKFL